MTQAAGTTNLRLRGGLADDELAKEAAKIGVFSFFFLFSFSFFFLL